MQRQSMHRTGQFLCQYPIHSLVSFHTGKPLKYLTAEYQFEMGIQGWPGMPVTLIDQFKMSCREISSDFFFNMLVDHNVLMVLLI